MTDHETMAELALQRFLSDPDGAETLSLAQLGLRSEQWDDEYIAAIGQHGLLEPSSWPMEQVAAFIQVHNLIYGGSVATVLVGTGHEPRGDAAREENAAVLATLPRPFRATVDMRQRFAQGDGLLEWDEPVRVSLATGLIDRRPDGGTFPLTASFKIPPGKAVLEIGSSLPSRTWSHLIAGGGAVARWPYDYNRLRLMVNLDETTTIGYLAGAYMESVLNAES
jgi:hypothetical protein